MAPRAAIERCYESAVVEWPAGLFPAHAATADMEATFGIDIDPAYA